jgi:MurNAc alpha-1-phosphate uridylyltransferase
MMYSHEGKDFGGALETAGGIARALTMLFDSAGNDAGIFWLLAGDVYVPGFEFDGGAVRRFAASGRLAHLWLVPNPEHNPLGDFGLQAVPGDGEPTHLALNLSKDSPLPRYTYSTIGLFSKALFLAPWCDIPPGNPLGAKAALAPLLRRAMDQGQVSAQIYTGHWTDVGTPERLRQLHS